MGKKTERGKMRLRPRESQVSDSLALGVLLTLAGGFQDAYSYMARDHVFANAQTGNIVLLGQNLAAREWGTALRYLLPLLAFVGGVYITEWIRYLHREHWRLHWRQNVLLLEMVLLTVVGMMPQGMGWNVAANVLLSFACAMQVDCFRKFRGLPSATTMCIGNLRSATEALGRYHMTKETAYKEKAKQYYFIILMFAVGAAVGAVLSPRLGTGAIWIAAGLQLMGFVLMFLQ